MDEQLFWACQLQHLGLASAPLLAKHATATVLSERIKAVLQSANLPLNALKAKDQIEPGQGTKKAVDLIEATLTQFNENT
jgi:sterol 3beta-glucosyltransferase